MNASDTGKIEAIRLEHLDIATANRLNSLLGKLKLLFRGNARITLTISGGHIETMEPCQILKLDDPPPKTVA